MNDMENIFQYKYRVEDLDTIIEKRNKGIMSVIPNDMEDEVKLRMKEIEIQLRNKFDDIGLTNALNDEETANLIKKHKELVDAEITKQRRNSHVDDFITIEISDEDKALVEELCSVSYVRKIPSLSYHSSDDDLYDTKERKELTMRVNKIKNVFYTPEDWKNAMMTLIEAWQYSYDHDFPGIPDSIKKGHVKLNRQMPKLILNYRTMITDPDILKGILNGDIKCLDSSESTMPKATRLPDDQVKYIPINKVGRVMSSREFEAEMLNARRGHNNMVAFINKSNNTVYNRLSPDAILNKNKLGNRLPNRLDENGYIRTFDFTQDGMGKKAFDIVSNKKKPSLSDFTHDIIKANNKQLTNVISASVFNEFSNGMKGINSNVKYNNYTAEVSNHQLISDPNVVAQEQALLNAMKMFNPGK